MRASTINNHHPSRLRPRISMTTFTEDEYFTFRSSGDGTTAQLILGSFIYAEGENLEATISEYETELIELIMAERSRIPATRQSHDFNDDLPFRPTFVQFSPRGRSPLA